MANICEPLNPLQREGSAQRSRLLDALRPENAKVDDREIKDWLLYARKYADLVRFYDLSNTADGDWSEFFDKDISILVALVADEDAAGMQDTFNDLKESVACADLRTELTDALGYLLGHMAMVADKLVTWERRAIPELSLHKTLSRLRASIIRDGFDQLYQYMLRAVELGATPAIEEKGPIDLQMIELTWPITQPSNGAAFLPKGLPKSAKQLEVELDFLERLFKRFIEVMHALVRQAPAFMNETLEKYPNHEPYMALFLAFLKLMQIAQEHMNTLTKRHLDFYYKEVLQLQPRAAVPDKVHVVLELAQNFNTRKLEAKTQFDAGKIGDNDITFSADNEVIINRGKLADDGLKTVFLEKARRESDENDDDALADREIINIFAAPDADTQDGEGTPFEEEPGKWDTLGSEMMPYGTVGFAIASPMLYLQEGSRTVKLNFFFENLPDIIDRYGLSVIKSEFKHNVDIYLSGEEDWIEIPVAEREIDINTEVTFSFTLTNEDEAVVGYNDEVLQDGFDTTLPVIKFVLDNEGLDTFRDVDLNMSAGLTYFRIISGGGIVDPDEEDVETLLFLPGEFIAVISDDGSIQIYRFNRDFVITTNQSGEFEDPINMSEDVFDSLLNTLLWEKQDDILTFLPFRNRPYEPGELVETEEGGRFIATARNENIHPDSQAMLWQDFSDNTFDPLLAYSKGDIISFNGQIWAARVDTSQGQSPPTDSFRNDFWFVLDEYSSTENYQQGDHVIFDNRIYEAAFGSDGIQPDSGATLWTPIDSFGDGVHAGQGKLIGILTGRSHGIYQLNVDEVDEPTFDPDKLIWRDLENYRGLDQGQYVVIREDDNDQYFVQNVDSTSVNPRLIDNNPIPVWKEESGVNAYTDGATATRSDGIEYIYKGRRYNLVANSTNRSPLQESSNPAIQEPLWRALFKAPYETPAEAAPDAPKVIYTNNVSRFADRTFYELNALRTSHAPPRFSENEIKILKPLVAYVEGGTTGTFKNENDYYIPADNDRSVYSLNALETDVAPDQGIRLVTVEKLPAPGEKDPPPETDFVLVDGIKEGGELFESESGSSIPIRIGFGKTFRFASDVINIYTAKATISRLPNLSVPGLIWAKRTIGSAINPKNFTLLRTGSKGADIILEFVDGDPEDQISEGRLYEYGPDTARLQFIAYADVINGSKIGTGSATELNSSNVWSALRSAPAVITGDDIVPKERLYLANDGHYQASEEVTVNERRFPFNSSDTIWEYVEVRELSVNGLEYEVVPPPDAADKYIVKENVEYLFVDALYTARGSLLKGTTIEEVAPPDADPATLVWEPVASDVVSPTEFDASEGSVTVEKSEVVSNSQGVFEANATVTTSAINSAAIIWSPEGGVVLEVTSGDNLARGSYIFFNTADYDYFLVNADTGENAPPVGADAFIWVDVRRSVDRYNPITIYEPLDLVQYEGGLFQAQATFRDVVPTSKVLIWRSFDQNNIPFFSSTTAYREGAIVQHDECVWKLTAATFGIAPSESEMQLTSQIPGDVKILQYNSLVTYDPTSEEGLVYVQFDDGRIYRPTERVNGEDPVSDPSKWRLVGTIQEFSNLRTYSTNCHVRFEDSIFRAKRIVEPGNPPILDPSVTDDNWELVANSYPYKYFHQLKFERVDLSADVRGIRSLILENDQGVIDPAKPFNPFGATPRFGSNFFIGSEEVFQKRLVPSDDRAGRPALRLDVEWGELPAMSFRSYYNGYLSAAKSGITTDENDTKFSNPVPINIPSNEHFEVQLQVLENGIWQPYKEEDKSETDPVPEIKVFSLFEDEVCKDVTDDSERCPIPGRTIEAGQVLIDKRRSSLGKFESFDVSLQGGFIRLHLLQDFYHSEFARSLATSAIKRADDENKGLDVVTDLVNEPYTPLINSISLDYFSREQINFRGKLRSDFDNRIDQFFHIYPFGQTEFFPIPEEPTDELFTSPYLVPFFEATSFNNEGNPVATDSNGNLYIGLQDVEPLQSIHILFQMAEGSEEPDRKKQTVTWAYLSHNRWKDIILPEEADDTNGLLRPGIVQLSLPRDITSDNTVLPKDVYWLRASVIDFADGIAKTIAVHPQAVRATFDINEENADRVSTPIGPGTISSLLVRQAAIGTVSQPFASFNGREKETDDQFYRRISERLRHKSRGISVVDYELLVLEAFIDVQQVKCLNHTSDASEHTPGEVRLVAIPLLQNKNAPDLLRPELSKNKREEIKKFVANHVSNFTSLDVVSPLYEQIRFHVTVKFKDGLDNAFYTGQLKKDLVLFVSPWKEDEGQDLEFSRRVNEADAVNYVDGLTYVDFVKHLEVHHEAIPDDFTQTKEAVPTTSKSVLTSVPDIQHRVIAYTEKK